MLRLDYMLTRHMVAAIERQSHADECRINHRAIPKSVLANFMLVAMTFPAKRDRPAVVRFDRQSGERLCGSYVRPPQVRGFRAGVVAAYKAWQTPDEFQVRLVVLARIALSHNFISARRVAS